MNEQLMMTKDDVTKWTIVKTNNYNQILETLEDAYEYSLLYCLIGFSGAGKTTAFKAFIGSHVNIVYLRLDKTYSKKDLYVELLRGFDQHDYGYDIPVRFLATRLTKAIDERKGKVLIIIDDASRFSSTHLEYFQSIFDANDGKLGIVLSGAIKFSSDFKTWCDKEKDGIPELATRIEEWIYLKRPTPLELKSVAKTNGVHDTAVLNTIVKGCTNFRQLRSRVIKLRKDFLKSKATLHHHG